MQQWTTLSREIILNRGKFLVVENHVVQLPDGRVFDNWPWIITPEYINVAVITEAGKFIVFRQTKYAVEGTSLAPVGGYLESGEDPLAAAKREVREEAGHESPDWISLGHYRVDGNRGAGMGHLYLARRAYRVGDIIADDLEEQELLYLTRAETEAALAAGDFKVLAWATVIALALLHMREV
jgi:ADP-ribose pyrophosphatase